MSKQGASDIVSVGQILAGKYRVEKILGMGGMGVVVAATHLDLREIRAIKLMRPDTTTDATVERFLREARAAVRLRSEHVAEVYDVGRLDSGAPYIVMEMLVGEDLAALTKRRGKLPIAEAVQFVGQACHALAEAHAAGIVHRDLKPGNLFLTRRTDGSACVKVLDFGISKHTRPEKEHWDPEMTGARDIMGSPLYMAPEQMRSARKVDARADVWALGAILFKLLTGMAPFLAPTLPEIFAAALAKPARVPSSFRPDIPPALDEVILRCLDKQPSNRFASAADLFLALRPFGPWGHPTQEDGDATLLATQGRRSVIPPQKKRLLLLAEDQASATPTRKEVTSESVSPWGATHARPTQKTSRRATFVALAALAAISGAALATLTTPPSISPSAARVVTHQFLMHGAAAAAAARAVARVEAAVAPDKWAPPPNDFPTILDADRVTPARSGTQPVGTMNGKGKPLPPTREGPDPFTGRR